MQAFSVFSCSKRWRRGSGGSGCKEARREGRKEGGRKGGRQGGRTDLAVEQLRYLSPVSHPMRLKCLCPWIRKKIRMASPMEVSCAVPSLYRAPKTPFNFFPYLKAAEALPLQSSRARRWGSGCCRRRGRATGAEASA